MSGILLPTAPTETRLHVLFIYASTRLGESVTDVLFSTPVIGC